MTELILIMASIIAALISACMILFSRLSVVKKDLNNAISTLNAVGNARTAINKQIKKERRNDKVNADSLNRRDYFSD